MEVDDPVGGVVEVGGQVLGAGDWSLERGFVTIINSHHDNWIKTGYEGQGT